MIDYLAEIRDFHREHVEPYQGKPRGCRLDEIDQLEKWLGFDLPIAYRQYLEWMGRDYEGIFVGCDWFITNVKDNQELLPWLLAENKISFQLPDHYVCFFSHQGYMAAWFELPKINENPTAWFYHEAMNMDAPIIEGVFTDVLFKDMRGLATYLPQIYRAK